LVRRLNLKRDLQRLPVRLRPDACRFVHCFFFQTPFKNSAQNQVQHGAIKGSVAGGPRLLSLEVLKKDHAEVACSTQARGMLLCTLLFSFLFFRSLSKALSKSSPARNGKGSVAGGRIFDVCVRHSARKQNFTWQNTFQNVLISATNKM